MTGEIVNQKETASEIVLLGSDIEAEQDKVSFIFNNLSLMNLTPKTHDMREVLKIDSNEQHSRWLSQYLVMKRASIEPNFHTLYASFLEVLKSEDLYDRVVKETYKNIAILLRADKKCGQLQ